MSVNRAYITSLGTTAILVASSLLVLAVTSAIVAFDGWPGHATAAAVDRVTVKIPPVAAQPPAEASTSSVTTTTTSTSVTGVTVSGTSGPGGAAPAAPTAPVEQPVPGGQDTTTGTAPVGRTTSAQQPPSTSPQQPAPRSGDPVRDTTGAAGDAVSPVSPEGGQAVANAGEAVATAIDAVVPVTR